jgi:hypothetical protein
LPTRGPFCFKGCPQMAYMGTPWPKASASCGDEVTCKLLSGWFLLSRLAGSLLVRLELGFVCLAPRLSASLLRVALLRSWIGGFPWCVWYLCWVRRLCHFPGYVSALSNCNVMMVLRLGDVPKLLLASFVAALWDFPHDHSGCLFWQLSMAGIRQKDGLQFLVLRVHTLMHQLFGNLVSTGNGMRVGCLSGAAVNAFGYLYYLAWL